MRRLTIDKARLKESLRASRGAGLSYKDVVKPLKQAEEIPAGEYTTVLSEEYKGFELQVNELQIPSVYKYQTVVVKDGKPIREIFVRSKTPQVSLNHFAKRAVDRFVKTGAWPKKQGLTIES